jgi:hypothetical protein
MCVHKREGGERISSAGLRFIHHRPSVVSLEEVVVPPCSFDKLIPGRCQRRCILGIVCNKYPRGYAAGVISIVCAVSSHHA